jgi:hypothetical protein
VTQSDPASINDREDRVTVTLIALGLVTNSSSSLQHKLEVSDAVELTDRDRQLRSARNHIPAALAAALSDPSPPPPLVSISAPPSRPVHNPLAMPAAMAEPAMKQTNKLSIRPMGKEKSVRFSLSANKSIRTGGGGAVQISGAEAMTPEQLEQFYKLTSGAFGRISEVDSNEAVGGGKSTALKMIGDLDARRLSRIPPLHDRPFSFDFTTGKSNALMINIGTLAKPAGENDITLKLNKMPAFLAGDYIRVGNEVMEVKGTLRDTLMVLRGIEGTAIARHEEGGNKHTTSTLMHSHSHSRNCDTII